MTVWKLLLGAAVFVIGSTGQASALEPMIDSFHLTDLLESQQVKVLEVRSDAKASFASHIPGSVYIPYGEFRGPEANPGKSPELTQLAKSLGSRGIDTWTR